MSRKIAPKASVTVTPDEAAFMNTEKGKLIFTVYQGRNCALTIRHDRLVAASFFSKSPSKIGAIYIGKIKNVAKNLDACFVEIAGGEICFLSMKNMSSPYLVNRRFDGRILEGDELLVQIIRDAQKGKRASVTTEISISNDYFAMILGSDKVGFSSKLDKEKKNSLKKLLTRNALIENGCLTQNCEKLLSPAEYSSLKSEGIALENLRLPPVGIIIRTMAGDWKQLMKGNHLDEVLQKTLEDKEEKFMKTETPLGQMHSMMIEEQTSSKEILRQFYDLSSQFIRLLYIAMSRSCFSCLKKAPLEFEPIVQQFIAEEAMGHSVEGHPMEKGDSMGEEHSTKEEHPMEKKHPMEEEHSMEEKHSMKEKHFATSEIITDQEALYEQIKEYCYSNKEIAAKNIKVRLYQDNLFPLSMLYSIDKKLGTALDSHVWLKSGGYLVIEPTEALTVIDVNSGKYESGKNSEEAYRKINLEAAKEIALQLRLRNLSGIIIVDFINIESVQDKKELLAYLKALVKYDRISTTVVDITALGLVEITRKKMNKPLWEQFLAKE